MNPSPSCSDANKSTLPEKYDPQQVEPHWQSAWQSAGAFLAPPAVKADGQPDPRPKYFIMEMFPYPSGRIHIGHGRNYVMGDVLARWTNDRWTSTLHRVINRISGRERWSIAYFYDLDAEASIEPLPTCTSAANPPRYAPITAGEHLEAMYRRTTVRA